MDKILVSLFLVAHCNTLNEVAGSHCDFENGMCGWKNEATNDVDCGWTLRKGLGVTLESGPFVDHTLQTPNGTYLYFQSSFCYQESNDGSVSVSLPVEGFVQESICVKFWYQMYGNGNSYVLGLQKGDATIFIQSGNKRRSWEFVQVSVKQSDKSPLTFLSYGDMSYADIALDDIDITDGVCGPPTNLCDFESGDLCGFTVTAAAGDFKWYNEYAANVATSPFYGLDHTLTSPTGHIAYAITAKSDNITAILSPVQKSHENEQCLTFYYTVVAFQSDGSKANLSVYAFTDKERNVVPAWSTVGKSALPFFEYATVPITLKGPYQYSFVAYNSEDEAAFSLDDITVMDGPCPALLTCSFTNGSLCGWTNIAQQSPAGGALAWVAEEPYPEGRSALPNTTSKPGAEGTYVFLDSKFGSPGSNTAAMYSQRFRTGANLSWCFEFAYRVLVDDDATAKLTVGQYFHTGGVNPDPRVLFETSNPTAGMWINVQLDLKPAEEGSSVLIISGDVEDAAKPSRIELDSFVLSNHACDARQR